MTAFTKKKHVCACNTVVSLENGIPKYFTIANFGRVLKLWLRV